MHNIAYYTTAAGARAAVDGMIAVKKEELDVRSPKAVTLPHGVMIALGSLAFLAAAAIWAPR